jgi:hypothetical protein
MLGVMLWGVAVGFLAGLIGMAPYWYFAWKDRKDRATDMTTGAT